MNGNKFTIKSSIHKSGIIFLFLVITNLLFSQAPTHYPTGNEPVDFTPVNIFIFIIVPVLFVIIYLWWRWAKRKEKRTKQEEKASD